MNSVHSQLNPSHISTPHLSMTYFNIILPCMPRSHNSLFPRGPQANTFHASPDSLTALTLSP
jgi:hypothetical protein